MSAAVVMDFDADTEEERLLAGLRAGDESAFEALVRANGARMLATARRFLRHEEDARDAVQDALLQAFRALPRFAGQARLSTWLHRIVVNAALMKLRSQRRRPETPLEELAPHFEADGAQAPARDDRPDAAIASAQLRALVRAAIPRLPERHRTVLILRDVEQLDTDETARRLGTSSGAVKTRLHRAHRALRALIESEHTAAGARFALSIEDVVAG
jgi:RNA polymerase sigma-70 factor (ECF subfamily)